MIDFLRPIDHKLLNNLFDPKEERVLGFWTAKAERHSAEFAALKRKETLDGLAKLSQLTKEEFEALRGLDRDQIQERFDFREEKIVPFWKMDIGFRLEQRGRLDLAREYFIRMHHNALILEQWAASQWFYHKRYCEPDEVTAQELAVIKALRDKAKQFRWFALAALVRIWLRCLVPFHETRFLPIPSIAKLRRVLRYDILTAYAEVKERATSLAQLSGEEFAQELALKS